MKATEQYFPVLLFIMLHKVVLTFESVHVLLGFIRWLLLLILVVKIGIVELFVTILIQPETRMDHLNESD